MGNPLERMVDKTDLTLIGLAVGVTLAGTGMYASIEQVNTLKEAYEVSTPIPWAESYLSTLKTFFSVAKYSVPISAAVGYVGSKILKRM